MLDAKKEKHNRGKKEQKVIIQMIRDTLAQKYYNVNPDVDLQR